MELEEQVLVALKLNINGKSTAELTQCANMQKELSKHQGYCKILMNLADCSSKYPIDLRQAALVQLKNNIIEKWLTPSDFNIYRNQIIIQEEERVEINSSILTAIIRVSNQNKLLKLYRTIVAHILRDRQIPVDQILGYIQSGQHVIPCLHYMHGASQFFLRTCRSKDEKQQKIFEKSFYRILAELLEHLSKVSNEMERLHGLMVQQMQTNEQQGMQQVMSELIWISEYYDSLVYMSMKLLTKGRLIFRKNSNMNLDCLWALIAFAVLNHQNEEILKSVINNQEDKTPHGHPKFWYLHAKKWAAKHLEYFVERRLIIKNNSEEHNKISDKFVRQNQQYIKSSCLQMFHKPFPRKVRYHQLKLMTKLVEIRPKIFQEDHIFYMSEILIPFLKTNATHESEALNSPFEFIESETNIYRRDSDKNLKTAATTLWLRLAVYRTKFITEYSDQADEKNVYGKNFQFVLTYLETKINSSNFQDRQLALHLIINSSREMRFCPPILNLIRQNFPNNIFQTFQSPSLVAIARVMDCLTIYVKVLKQKPILQNCKQIVLQGILNRTTPDYVKIKSIHAFQILVKHDQFTELHTNTLETIMDILTELLQKYEEECILRAFDIIVLHFHKKLQKNLDKILAYITTTFCKYFQKEKQSQFNCHDYSNNTYNIMERSLGILALLIRVMRTSVFTKKVEDCIVIVMSKILINSYEDELQNGLVVLNKYLFYQKDQSIPETIWFFYYIFIYRLAGGLSKHNLQISKKLGLFSPTQIELLQQSIETNSHQYMDYIPIIRNFIKKLPENYLVEKNYVAVEANVFQSSKIQHFFYMIEMIFLRAKKTIQLTNLKYGNKVGKEEMDYRSQNQIFEAFEGIIFCTLQLIYFVENHSENMLESNIIYILDYCKAVAFIEMIYFQYEGVRKTNLQLLCLLYWSCTHETQSYLNQLNQSEALQFFEKTIGKDQHDPVQEMKFNHQPQDKRIILGFTQMVFNHDSSKFLFKKKGVKIFDWLCFLINQIATFEESNYPGEKNLFFYEKTIRPEERRPHQSDEDDLSVTGADEDQNEHEKELENGQMEKEDLSQCEITSETTIKKNLSLQEEEGSYESEEGEEDMYFQIQCGGGQDYEEDEEDLDENYEECYQSTLININQFEEFFTEIRNLKEKKKFEQFVYSIQKLRGYDFRPLVNNRKKLLQKLTQSESYRQLTNLYTRYCELEILQESSQYSQSEMTNDVEKDHNEVTI